ncbi:MAG TPA: AsmA-like C-terminal region-containing protein, partial [Chthoniobacterales bacterium]|nr:AsmA-like C-terminal region-containing protein [Chthoniobacterales bacterium]
VGFEGLACDFAWDGTRTMLRDIRLRQRSGQLNADLFEAPDDFRLNVDSTIAPTAFAPLAPAKVRSFLQEWEWARPPGIHLNIRGTSRDPKSWRGEGTFALGRSRFRGVWMNSASAGVKFGDGVLALDNFRVTRDEGSGSGSFAYDAGRNELRLTNVQSTLKPGDAIMWVEPRFYEHVSPYRFHRPPRVNVSGVVQFGGGKQTRLQIDVAAPDGMDYTFIDKVLPFDRISGQLLFTDDRLQILGLKGTLFHGSLTGGADISLAKGDKHYSANVAVEKVDFPSLTDLYFKYKTAEGVLGGKFDFGGVAADKKALHGAGDVEVTDGNVFAIPIFGPLSDLVNKMFNGVGYSVAHEATAPFTIRNGVIHTDRLKVAAKLFAMLGHGDINFLKDQLDFDIRIDVSGPGAVLMPLYKLFEYHGEGSLTKPVWRPKRF